MSTRNPTLIRLVAGNYRELQGLSTVANAAALLILSAVIFWEKEGRLALVLAVVLVAYLVARWTWVRSWIDAYYTSRCGQVGWSPTFQLLPNWIFMMFVQSVLTGPALPGMHFPALVRVPWVLLTLGFYPAWVVVRDRPFRTYWLLPLAIAVLCAVKYAAVTTNDQANAWQAFALFVGGMAVAVAGLGDHLLLLNTLGKAHDLSDAPNPSQTTR